MQASPDIATSTQAAGSTETAQQAAAGNNAGRISIDPQRIRSWAQVGAFTSLAMVFGYIETFIPVPLPGVKIGLANIVVLVALATLPLPMAGAVAALKTLATGLLFGSPLTFAYSAAGTALSFAAMALLARTRRITVTAISIVGATFHNMGQLLVAQAILGTSLVWAYAPMFAVASVITGYLTGKAAGYTLKLMGGAADGDASRGSDAEGAGGSGTSPGQPAFDAVAMAALMLSDSSLDGVIDSVPIASLAVPGTLLHRLDPIAKLVGLLVLTGILFQAQGAAAYVACLAISVVLALVARVNMRRALRMALPLCIIACATALLQAALTPGGVALLHIGGIRITQAGAEAAATTIVRLICPVLLSVAFVYSTPIDRMQDALRRILEPLSRIGIQTDGLLVTLSIAFAFIPIQAQEFERLRETAADAADAGDGDRQGENGTGKPGMIAKLASYTGIFSQLITRSMAYANELALAMSAHGTE